MSMRIDLEVLSSFDFIITTSTSESVSVSVSWNHRERQAGVARVQPKVPSNSLHEPQSKFGEPANDCQPLHLLTRVESYHLPCGIKLQGHPRSLATHLCIFPNTDEREPSADAKRVQMWKQSREERALGYDGHNEG